MHKRQQRGNVGVKLADNGHKRRILSPEIYKGQTEWENPLGFFLTTGRREVGLDINSMKWEYCI